MNTWAAGDGESCTFRTFRFLFCVCVCFDIEIVINRLYKNQKEFWCTPFVEICQKKKKRSCRFEWKRGVQTVPWYEFRTCSIQGTENTNRGNPMSDCILKTINFPEEHETATYISGGNKGTTLWCLKGKLCWEACLGLFFIFLFFLSTNRVMQLNPRQVCFKFGKLGIYKNRKFAPKSKFCLQLLRSFCVFCFFGFFILSSNI